MQFTDTHSHIYSEQFDSDQDEMIQRAFDSGVDRIYMPNIDSGSIEAMKKVQQKYPDHCLMMMGLHPCSVGANVQEELEKIKNALEDGDSYFAIGEIGIDLYWDKTFIKEQEMAFRTQINWAKERDLPIVIHCREAFDEILKILDEENDDTLRGIFHCFTGSIDQAKHILSYENFKLGIGGVLTFKNAGLDRVVSQLSISDLVLETDSPYLAPVPYRGKRNESVYLIEIASKLSSILNLPMEEIAQISNENAQAIFSKSYKKQA